MSIPTSQSQLNVLNEISGQLCCLITGNEHVFIRRADDVNSDGTDLQPFVEVYTKQPDGSYELSYSYQGTPNNPYTPVGTVLDLPDVGSIVKQSQERTLVENGSTWSSEASTLSYVIKAISVTGTPTFTDTEGVVTPIYAGETISYSVDEGESSLLKDGVTLTTTVGDTFIVEHSKIPI